MWQLFEPIHDVIYFCAKPRSAGSALGFRGFWMAYFAFRSAPLGLCDPAVVAATFYGFHQSRVRRALPDAWSFAAPAGAIAARQTSAGAALRRIWRAAGIPLAASARRLTWCKAVALGQLPSLLDAQGRSYPRIRG